MCSSCPTIPKKDDFDIDEIDVKGKKCILNKIKNKLLSVCYMNNPKIDAYIDSKNKVKLNVNIIKGNIMLCESVETFINNCH